MTCRAAQGARPDAPRAATSRLVPLLAVLMAGCRAATPAAAGPAPAVEAPSPAEPAPVVELVESVPAEIGWDTPGVRGTQEVWLEMIRRARRSIDLAQFYLANKAQEPLEPVIRALIRAAARGVKIRVLVDRSFIGVSRQTFDRLAAAPNIDAGLFDIRRRTGGILHAKYFVVDRRDVFIGSQNFDWRALKHIHEIGLRIRDRSVALTLGRIFDADWALMKGRRAPAPPAADADRDGLADGVDPAPRVPAWAPRRGQPALLYVVASPPSLNPAGVIPAADRLIRLIDAARDSLVVQLLKYSVITHRGARWRRVDDALRRAAGRGVKIRMNLSHWNKSKRGIGSIQALARLPCVEIKLNTIPPHSSGFIPHARVDHSKYMIVDGRTAWIGTSNWSGDYFTASRNVEVVLQHVGVVGQLFRIFQRGWTGPHVEPLDPDRVYEAPRVR